MRRVRWTPRARRIGTVATAVAHVLVLAACLVAFPLTAELFR